MSSRDEVRQRNTYLQCSQTLHEMHTKFPKSDLHQVCRMALAELHSLHPDGSLKYPDLYAITESMLREVARGRAVGKGAGGGVYKPVDWLEPVFPPAPVKEKSNGAKPVPEQMGLEPQASIQGWLEAQFRTVAEGQEQLARHIIAVEGKQVGYVQMAADLAAIKNQQSTTNHQQAGIAQRLTDLEVASVEALKLLQEAKNQGGRHWGFKG